MTPGLRRVLKAVPSLLLTLGAALGAVVLLGVVLGALFDVRPVVITSGSMEPEIGTGSLALVRTVPGGEVEVGQVVTVQTSTGSRVTHRVIDATPLDGGTVELRLQGDANPTPDLESYRVEEAGLVVADLPFVGYALSAARTPVGLVALGAVAAVLVGFVMRGGSPRLSGRRMETMAAIAVVVSAGCLPAVGAVSSRAAWVDPVDVSGTTLTAYAVPRPAIASCTVTGPALGQKTATIVWPEVTSPHALDYTAEIVETGQVLIVVDNGTTRQTQFHAGLLSTVLNQTYNIRITASLPAPNAAWTKVSNQPVTVTLLGLGLTCGSAT